MEWNLMVEVLPHPQIEVSPSRSLRLVMNIIAWNCRGALKPNFQDRVRDLVREHDPAIFVVMETKLGGTRAKQITDRLPFDGAIHTDTIGFARGLWLLWDSSKVEVFLLSKTKQEIHVSVKVHSLDSTYFFSAIYASPRLAERRVLWNNLCLFAKLHNMPWFIAGDFNEPLSNEDKFRGRVVNSSRSLEFKECLDYCNMIDLGFSGPRFTWTNKREVGALIQERIDKFFVNPSWCTTYPDAKIFHLTRCHSDHCPVLLESKPINQRHLPRPFKF